MILGTKAIGLVASGTLALNIWGGPRHLGVNTNANVKASPKAESGERPGLLKKFFERAAIGTGTLSAKSGTTLTIAKDTKSFTVLTDSNTQFRRKFWGKSSLSEMKVGDKVTVIGQWTDTNHTSIQAKLVRDLSIQKRSGVFFGMVKSLTPDGWVISTKRGDETVTVSTLTKLVNRRQQPIVQADIKVGDRVRVKGLWDKVANTLTEVVQVKDFSLPVLGSGSPSPTPTATP
ncbi:hypothetical protein HY045_01605 [Candidatus Woesebacteria bacterium]|nr:hypothetical protein [Candidatus Woesebacteria bacterium]